MTYFLNINAQKMIEWGLSFNESAVMCIFADLESWATKYRSAETNDGDFYYLLYQSKLLSELPMLGSVRTVSRAVSKLESLGLIKSINKHSTPAYALTEKGIAWKKVVPHVSAMEQPNGGESAPGEEPAKKERKKHAYALRNKTRAEDLGREYLTNLHAACIKMANDKAIPNPQERYEEFLEHHSKHGNKFSNWLSAFGTWLRNHNKFNKPKGGEFAPDGLYQ